MKKDGQIAIEFMILVGMSFFLLFTIIIVLYTLADSRIKEKSYYELNDFGAYVQQELLMASELESGYARVINIPQTVNGKDFTIITGNSSAYNGYMLIEYLGTELYYSIPVVNGTLVKGTNVIKVRGGAISIE